MAGLVLQRELIILHPGRLDTVIVRIGCHLRNFLLSLRARRRLYLVVERIFSLGSRHFILNIHVGTGAIL